jgi:FAD/FMN-containing dehydrogenase
VCGGAVPLLGGITIDTKRMQQLRAVHSAELICDVEAGMSGGAVRARAGAARLHVRALPSSIYPIALSYCSMVSGLVATHELRGRPAVDDVRKREDRS